ncbi:sulfotransferase [Verrucomicrobiaceae bacterium N1E253]|uniref:Sulfotransferase n=1 Tax=Oceaniferula marina TaxID=2748318 RepID=A0A851GHL8_9BACT|nr:sulfotransferase [Oceaniferula marina]NWK57023.1 sulfotransferase [Oceaniferula marina]
MVKPSQVLQRQIEKAVLLAQQGRFDIAIPRYVKLIKRLPDDPELRLQLANALGLSGRRAEAHHQHEVLRAALGAKPELEVRIGRDLFQWQDYEGALNVWDRLYSVESNWMSEAFYHRIRTSERLGRISEARMALEEAQMAKVVGSGWGWDWLAGRLAEREGKLDEAESYYRSGLDKAGENEKAGCRCSLARLALRKCDGASLSAEIKSLQTLRGAEAAEIRKLFPLSNDPAVMPQALDAAPDMPNLIVLVGFPRAGTTLLARLLAERFGIPVSEEYPYLEQLINRWGQPGRQFPDPETLAHKNVRLRGKAIESYWQAQRETLKNDFAAGDYLIDKNPSQAGLLPWLVGLIPGLQVIWCERDPRDLWLSSVTLDVPVNPVSCWWQDPTHFASWVRSQHALSEKLQEHLEPSRFQRVDYAELVDAPVRVLERLESTMKLPRSDKTIKLESPRSPSYAEAVEPPHKRAFGRWPKLVSDLDPSSVAIMEGVAIDLGFTG